MPIVRFAVYRRRLYAACCNFEVVNGGGGLGFFSFCVTEVTCHCVLLPAATTLSAASWFDTSISSPLYLLSLASKIGGCPASSIAWIDQYSTGTNARISNSRSTINRTATVCTRPADSPRRTLSHSKGEILYPTMRSRTRRACCASTRFESTC